MKSYLAALLLVELLVTRKSLPSPNNLVTGSTGQTTPAVVRLTVRIGAPNYTSIFEDMTNQEPEAAFSGFCVVDLLRVSLHKAEHT